MIGMFFTKQEVLWLRLVVQRWFRTALKRCTGLLMMLMRIRSFCRVALVAGSSTAQQIK
ncbi:hypothetical protein GCM10009413_27130 [Tatumella punctata]